MSRRRGQQGQALVAALVTMALLFSIAGGLAVAVSAALEAQGPSTSTYLRDTAAASATAAIISRVAGAGAGCPLGAVYGDVTSYGCHQLDMVVPDRVQMAPLQWSGKCAVAALNATGHVTAWLNTMVSGSLAVYIDSQPAACSQPVGGPCSASPSSAGPGFFYVIRDCVLGASGSAYLHVAGSAGAARVGRVAGLASFVVNQTITARPGVAPVLAARLHGSGQPLDLVVANPATGCLSMFTGLAGGAFSATQTGGPLCAAVSAITAADFGTGPLIAASTSDGSVLLIGISNGALTVLRQYSLGTGLGSVAIASGHFTGGGGLDLAVANHAAGSVSILQGLGGADFKYLGDAPVPDPPVAVAGADFGSQGYLLVATAESDGGDLFVFSPKLSGNCSPAKGQVCLKTNNDYGLGGVPGAMIVSRFTASGNPDVAIALPDRGQVLVGTGSSSGAFAMGRPINVGTRPAALAAGNFGGPAGADLAVANSGAGSASVLLGNGDGTFQPIAGGDLVTGRVPMGAAAGDFDGSGGDGLAVANAGDGTLTVFLRNRSKLYSLLAGAPDGSAINEADLLWSYPTRANTLSFEGGLG